MGAVSASDELVLVWSTSSVPEAEVAKARLEDEGIAVLMKGGSEGPYRMGPAHLFVPASLEVQARLILDVPQEPISDEELGALAEQAEEPEEAP
jgi:hypothetical protein